MAVLKTRLALLSIVSIGGALVVYGLCAAEAGGRTFGPYSCPTCTLGMPMPDAGTSAFISKMNEEQAFGVVSGANLDMQPSDSIIICNGTACGTYVRSSDVNPARYYGTKREPQSFSGDSRGGNEGGGSGGSAGGGGAGGGSGSGGSGTVKVGPVEKEAQ